MEDRVYIDKDNYASFICKQCGKSKTVDVQNYLKIDKPVRVKSKCPCGYHSVSLLERRKHYRKKTHLPGVFVCCNRKRKGTMVVTDLSSGGVRFKLKETVSFDIGEIVLLEFNLDNNSRLFISKKVRIRSVNGRESGAEFCDMDPAESAYKAIKFYVY